MTGLASCRSRGFASAVSLLVLSLSCHGGGDGTSPPPARADFALQVSPANVQIPAGGSAFVTVTLSRLNGFSSAVTLSGVGLPAGVVASGSIPAGASTLQLPVIVDPAVMASTYTGISLRGQSGTLRHDSTLGLTVTPALPAGHLRVDLVEAAGGRQAGGTLENHAVVREGMPAQTVTDANGTTRVRQGFTPTGVPAAR